LAILGLRSVRGGRGGSSLKTYIALLRGINLGARNKVAMADLRALFSGLGAEDVTTYVQSGNVVFKSPEAAGPLVEVIEKSIRRDLGLSVSVMLRTRSQMAKVLAGNPFGGQKGDATKLHVTFLAAKPAGARVRKLDPKLSAPDEFRVVGGEIYLLCPNGYGRSQFSNAYFEKELGVTATTRNWRTVTRLAEIAGA
jgi:uncharacterized protein (DUF1697 family)